MIHRITVWIVQLFYIGYLAGYAEYLAEYSVYFFQKLGTGKKPRATGKRSEEGTGLLPYLEHNSEVDESWVFFQSSWKSDRPKSGIIISVSA